MKKLLIVLSIVITSFTALAFATPTTSTLDDTPQERKAKRHAAEEASVGEMKAALAEQSFVFYPTSYTLPYQDPVMVYNRTNLYLNFYPTDLDINLPFQFQTGRAIDFDAALIKYSDYTVKAAGKDGVNFIVTAELNNVSNTSFSAGFEDQDVNLDIHILINVASRVAFLTITPDFSAAVTYQGTIVLH